MLYQKIKRVWSHNDMNCIKGFREAFPELKNVNSEELADRWIDLGIEFYMQKETPVKWWIRLTLPFALILMFLMFVFIPFNFIFTMK